MGASESLADQFQVVENFNNFIDFAGRTKKSNLLSTLKPHINNLKSKTEKFFDMYARLVESKKIGGDDIDLNTYFQKIVLSIEAFRECVDFIKKNDKKDEIATVSVNFRNDLRKFIKQVTQLASTVTQILEELMTKADPSLMTLFYFELDIFEFSLNVSKSDKPPYYAMSILPAYELREQLHSIDNPNVNITGPHASGKTTLVPLFLASRLLKKSRHSIRFIIVIEHETSFIRHIKDTYRQICYKDEWDKYDYDDDNCSLYITSSLGRISSLVADPPYYPVIAILSPLDALRLLHTVDNMQDFVSKSIFVIDDVHMRTTVTDVLAQDLQRSIPSQKKSRGIPRLVSVSTVQDTRFLRFVNHHDDLSVKSTNSEVDRREVRCASIAEIMNKRLFREMHTFFSTWIEDSAVSVGSVVVFVPSEKVGQRVNREICKFYSGGNAANVCPLKATIRKGESTDDFYARLQAEMTIAEGERADGTQTLFLMPLFLSSNPPPEHLALLKSQLPLPFTDKLARVFITTIENEPQLQVHDLMVIFDTGIEEVEFFDTRQSTYHVREQLLPKPYIDQHWRMLGSCGDGLYFEFVVNGKERPDSRIPSVKRSDLGRQLMILRSFGVNLEDQRNLPNEPDHELLDACFDCLRKIGVIDETEKKSLTEVGKEAARYASVSPFFAVATAKYNENRQFAFLCSLIIENSRTLVTDPKSKLLCRHFCRDSDVVTLLESIREVCEGGSDAFEGSGLSIGAVYAMYTQMGSTFDGADGRTAVINAVKWASGQAGGTIGAVDRFISLIDKTEFTDRRRCRFVHVLGAGPGSEPTLVYSASDDFKFSRPRKGEDGPCIKFARRPGWLGLQSPGNVIVLSVVVDEESKLNRGLIIHRDPSGDSPGVVSQRVDNPSLNNFFFVSLFDAYWAGHSTVNEFVGIYHTHEPKNESAFLIHMNESDGSTYLNYCPKTAAVDNAMREAIPILSSLMPFVPRSIIAKVDVPICAVEVNSYGTSQQYTTHIHLILEPETDLPFVYPINKATLEYAAKNINTLRAMLPLIRFAITGESFYYKSVHGREVEADLTYPDVTPTIQSVFDQNHSSHLVLIVDKGFPNKPPVPPLPWVQPGAAAEADTTDTEDNAMMVDVASKIMTGLGHAERSADLFYVTLGNGYPAASQGTVPDVIKGMVGFSAGEGGAIKQGVYPLVRHFVKEFTRKQKLTGEIPLKELGSTNGWPHYPHNDGERDDLCDRVSKAVASQFHIKDDDVQCTFLGQSMLVVRVNGIDVNAVTHRVKSDIWDDTYQPCPADATIRNALQSVSANFQISQVVHEPSISVSVRHLRRFNMSEEDFTNKIKDIAHMFGFLHTAVTDYIPPADLEEIEMGILGTIDVELIGMASGIVLATIVTREFPLKTKDDLGLTCTMATCMGMATINPRLGPAPKIGIMQKAMKVTPAEVEALKELVAMKNAGQKKKKWKVDANFNVLIIPATEEAAAQEMMRNLRDKENDTTCIFVCDPPQVFLPQSLYCYEKDGSVRTIAVCKQCMVENFRAMEDLIFVMDPLTYMIDRRNLVKLENNLPGFPFIDDGKEEGGEMWPQIPLGQAAWTLMSAPDELGPYVKAWFTAIIDFIVKKARNYFTFCPNHPDIPHRTPKPGTNLKCPYCNMFFCDTCKRWHAMEEKCAPINDGIKRCPNCMVPTFKYSGCNHITCPCGKHWCYKCTTSPIFNTAGECYSHLTAVHGGYST